MNVKRLLLSAAGMLALAVLSPTGAGASGQPATRLDCTFGVHLAFNPGISPAMEAIRITSTAPGPLSCEGTWAGRQVIGQGQVTFEGDAVGNCGGSTIDAVVRLMHPLVGGGRMELDVPVRSGRAGMALYGQGSDPARSASLVGTGTPDAGQDCREVPITGIAAEGRAIFGPWR
jgi:hypothetical protein